MRTPTQKAAAMIGRLGGKAGTGAAKRRRTSGRIAALARWKKKESKTK